MSEVERIQQSLTTVIAEAQGLRSDVAEYERARRRATAITLVVIAIAAVLIVLVLAVGWQNNQLSQQTRNVSDQIKSCTVHTGSCYKEGQQRSGQIVKQLIAGSVYVAECQKTAGTDAELERCVAGKLSAKTGGP